MNTVHWNAHAKFNLTLDLLGRSEGYHLIDSLVTTVDLADKIVVHRRKDQWIKLTMHGMGSEEIPLQENNALRAGEAFQKTFQTPGADIVIYKNIPIGAGLGGSSADAAGVLRALSRLYGISDWDRLKALADELGSDTGYLLTGGFARLRGRGEQVEFLGEVPKFNFLLLCPKRGVSTAECYSKSENYPPVPKQTEEVLQLLRAGDLEGAAGRMSNGLSRAAQELNLDVEIAAQELKSFSPWGVSMTGSGSGVFAIFESMELCAWAKSRYRGKFRAMCLKAVPAKSRGMKNPYDLSESE